MFTVSFTQSGFFVWKWIPRRRTATAWVTRGALHLRACALSLQAISKAGLAFYFVSGAKDFQILGRSSGPCTSANWYREGACRSHLSAGSFLLGVNAWATSWFWMMYVGVGMAGPAGVRSTICIWSIWRLTVMCSASSIGGRYATPGHVL